MYKSTNIFTNASPWDGASSFCSHIWWRCCPLIAPRCIFTCAKTRTSQLELAHVWPLDTSYNVHVEACYSIWGRLWVYANKGPYRFRQIKLKYALYYIFYANRLNAYLKWVPLKIYFLRFFLEIAWKCCLRAFNYAQPDIKCAFLFRLVLRGIKGCAKTIRTRFKRGSN